jgi:hypothetical protein
MHQPEGFLILAGLLLVFGSLYILLALSYARLDLPMRIIFSCVGILMVGVVCGMVFWLFHELHNPGRDDEGDPLLVVSLSSY